MTASEVPHWSIVRGWKVDPSPDLDTEAGWAVTLRAPGAEARVTVEFVRGSNLGSAAAALEALRPYLDFTAPPPPRLVIAHDRTVSGPPH